MKPIEDIIVDITIELGAANMPIHHLLKLGRGAVIELDATEHDPMKIYANDKLVAHGEIKIDEGQLSVKVSEKLMRKA